MNITILYDNEVLVDGTQSDWGFACLVRHRDVTLLFDTGASGAILLANMKLLGIDPASIDEVFVSHMHFDHAGGLSSFLDINNRVRVFAPSPMRGIRSAREVIYIDKPRKLRDHFYTTGLLNDIEQSLAVRTDEGMVVIVGCAHPGVGAILEAVRPLGKPHALIGGLHGFAEFDLLEQLQLVCPTHCTQHLAEIRSRYPDKFIEGGVGGSIEI